MTHFFKVSFFILLFLACSFWPTSLLANDLFSDGLRLSTSIGASQSLPNSLTIHREDQPDYHIQAFYTNKPFDDSQYWSGRLEYWKNKSSFEIELIHHKIYLQNYPQGLVDFSISDGYNLLYLNKAWALPKNQLAFRTGLGVVIAHPDITFTDRARYIVKGINGLRLAGVSGQVAFEQRYNLSQYHYLKYELKFTASYAKTAISGNLNEYVIAPDFAFHATFGIGSHPIQKASIKTVALYTVPGFLTFVSGKVFDLK